MPPEPRPLQVPRGSYSEEEESLFRRELENTIIEIAGRIDRVESGKSSMSTSSVLRIFLHTVPIGQVEVG
jgi:hypothetical protein